MRKLSLFIIAASATLGVAVAQAEDAPQAVEGPDAVTVEPEIIVDPMPEDVSTGEVVDPALETEELVLYPVDKVVELTDEQVVEDTAVEDGAVDDTAVDPVEGEVATDDGGDDAGVVEDTGSTDENPEKVDDSLIYMTTTSTDTGRGPRPRSHRRRVGRQRHGRRRDGSGRSQEAQVNPERFPPTRSRLWWLRVFLCPRIVRRPCRRSLPAPTLPARGQPPDTVTGKHSRCSSPRRRG